MLADQIRLAWLITVFVISAAYWFAGKALIDRLGEANYSPKYQLLIWLWPVVWPLLAVREIYEGVLDGFEGFRYGDDDDEQTDFEI